MKCPDTSRESDKFAVSCAHGCVHEETGWRCRWDQVTRGLGHYCVLVEADTVSVYAGRSIRMHPYRAGLSREPSVPTAWTACPRGSALCPGPPPPMWLALPFSLHSPLAFSPRLPEASLPRFTDSQQVLAEATLSASPEQGAGMQTGRHSGNARSYTGVMSDTGIFVKEPRSDQ